MVLSVSSSDVVAPLTSRHPDQVIWLDGEHDVNTLSTLTDTLTRAVGADDSDVIVDLSGVTFMCAATIGALIGGRNSLRRQSRSLTLRSPSSVARRVLDLCGIPLEHSSHPISAR